MLLLAVAAAVVVLKHPIKQRVEVEAEVVYFKASQSHKRELVME